MSREESIIARWRELGQGHLFEHWERREQERRRRLLEDLERLDPALVESLQQRLAQAESPPARLQPLPHIPEADWREDRQARGEGEALVRAGKVGYLTVAGGQGSRLGYDGPKGCFPISPLRHASLFQILAEKLLAARRRYQRPTYWYIMGNPYNLERIRSFFRDNGFFGLPEEELSFFAQGTFPSLTAEGRLLLATDGSVFKNPNGHGGTLQALHESGLLPHMRDRGLEELCYTQVDNPLVRVPDLAFLGTHRRRSSQMSSKVIAKVNPEEKLGVIARIDGRPGVVEYSDLDEEHQNARDSAGRLLYSHGSIAIHVLNLAFLERLDYRLPLHQAHKRVACWLPGPDGGREAEREAVKFERFIFDAIPRAGNPLFFETDRTREFAPLKNATGDDSIETCRRGMIELQARWLEEAGLRVARKDGRVAVTVEISPLYATGPEVLKERLLQEKPLQEKPGDSVNLIDEDILLE